MAPFTKVLVANRGEIAVRIFRTLRELGIGTVAVYSDADRGRLHTQVADEAYRIGPGPADESYLLADVIVETALRAGAEAVHPGYGFLAENAAFARKVEEAGLTWIGPPPAAIELMGSKTEARTAMKAAGVPIIPGATDPVRTVEGVIEIGEEIGYPLIIKAAAGGGGKGMELVSEASGAAAAFEAAQRQGLKFFADDAVYVERYLEGPRHVEAQILADDHGTVLFLGERDCTIQRRHQKLIEETPSPAVDEALRERIGEIAVNAARAAGYRSAGTIEGLLTAAGEYFFMEMNTRIQVEHTVTELVTGLDLVREQILIAQGEPISVRQEDVSLRGHAIECRINAEDVGKGFLPAPGLITAYEEPSGPGVRVDSGVRAGDEISGLYDPMIAKLIVHDTEPRDSAAEDASCARRVPDRRAADAARVPCGAALGAMLHRGRDLPRARGVRGARPASGGDDGVVLSSDNNDTRRLGRHADPRARRRRRGRRAVVRRPAPHDRAAVGGARASPPGAERRRRRSRLGRRHEPDAGHAAEDPRRGGRHRHRRPGDLRRRGDEDGERDRRTARRRRRPTST